MSRRRIMWLLVSLAVAGAIFFGLRPSPIAVETAPVSRGRVVVTVDEEGETRVRDRYVVVAPTAGRVLRIALDPGDPVDERQTVAFLRPTPLDRRARAGAEARVEAAQAHQEAADAAVLRADAALAQARRDAARMSQLHARGAASDEQLERSRLEESTRTQELAAARHAARAAAFELDAARSVLLAAESGDAPVAVVGGACGGEACIEVRSPVSGRVLRIPEKSERIVLAGEPLVEIGDPGALEIVVDVLSADAVRIRPGARIWLERWGGDRALAAHVRRVEPSGFTKVSTLGVEEQRVNVIGDLDAAPQGLGDGYRVEARVVVFEADDVVRVPPTALFRRGDEFAVFVVENGIARARTVGIGERGADAAEVRSGIEPGERVILHPSDRIEDGVRVREEAQRR
jgi:HlyD family secretion protein